MSQSTTQIEVTLLGKSHQFACTEGQEEALLNAAELLNAKVDEMKQRSSIRSEQKALLMAALQLCFEIKEQEQSQEALVEKLQSHLDNKPAL